MEDEESVILKHAQITLAHTSPRNTSSDIDVMLEQSIDHNHPLEEKENGNEGVIGGGAFDSAHHLICAEGQ